MFWLLFTIVLQIPPNWIELVEVRCTCICFTVFQVAGLPMVESGHHSIILEVFLDRAAHHHLQPVDNISFTTLQFKAVMLNREKEKGDTSPFDR